MQGAGHFVEQATQNIAGGRAPCTDTTTHPEIDGITLLAGKHKPGEFLNVKILKTADYDLIAEASA